MKKTSKIQKILKYVLVLFVLSVVVFFLSEKINISEIISPTKKEDNKKECMANGVRVNPSYAQRLPLAVMVENHTDARPQVGLDKADIVYEGLVEGAITRFMAIYQCQEAEKIGPVRSARSYFLDWVRELGAVYVHAGGSMEAWNRLASENILDINEFFYGSYFWREFKAGIGREHVLFTKTTNLRQIVKEKKWSPSASFTLWKFKDDSPTPTSEGGTVKKITIDFSQPLWQVIYKYNPKTNSYLRFMGGQPHLDRLTQKQLNPKNVIIQFMQSWKSESYGHVLTTSFQTTGEGEAKIFLDGKIINGKWRKKDLDSRTRYFDENNKEVKFNRGQIWIEAVAVGTKVTVE
jgi:hypothetical protein